MTHADLATRTLQPLRLLLYVSPLVVLLLLVPYVTNPYQTFLLSYGLVMAIAALGFNLLLGYTGLLSFGHSAYFGVGAYAVAFMVKYLHITSMELFLLGGVLATAVVTALFGFVCVRYTRIFFSILTMALSQVLWSLAYKFFWVTGGTDGMRVPTPSLLVGLIDGVSLSYTSKIVAYYYYVLAFFLLSVGLMWLIVHSPFGKALQAIRDNETRASFIGVQVQRYRWLAFLMSGVFTGLAGILWVPLNGLTTPDILVWTLFRAHRVLRGPRWLQELCGAHPWCGGIQLSRDLCHQHHGVLAGGAGRGPGGTRTRHANGNCGPVERPA